MERTEPKDSEETRDQENEEAEETFAKVLPDSEPLMGRKDVDCDVCDPGDNSICNACGRNV